MQDPIFSELIVFGQCINGKNSYYYHVASQFVYKRDSLRGIEDSMNTQV